MVVVDLGWVDVDLGWSTVCLAKGSHLKGPIVGGTPKIYVNPTQRVDLHRMVQKYHLVVRYMQISIAKCQQLFHYFSPCLHGC